METTDHNNPTTGHGTDVTEAHKPQQQQNPGTVNRSPTHGPLEEQPPEDKQPTPPHWQNTNHQWSGSVV